MIRQHKPRQSDFRNYRSQTGGRLAGARGCDDAQALPDKMVWLCNGWVNQPAEKRIRLVEGKWDSKRFGLSLAKMQPRCLVLSAHVERREVSR